MAVATRTGPEKAKLLLRLVDQQRHDTQAAHRRSLMHVDQRTWELAWSVAKLAAEVGMSMSPRQLLGWPLYELFQLQTSLQADKSQPRGS